MLIEQSTLLNETYTEMINHFTKNKIYQFVKICIKITGVIFDPKFHYRRKKNSVV